MYAVPQPQPPSDDLAQLLLAAAVPGTAHQVQAQSPEVACTGMRAFRAFKKKSVVQLFAVWLVHLCTMSKQKVQ